MLEMYLIMFGVFSVVGMALCHYFMSDFWEATANCYGVLILSLLWPIILAGAIIVGFGILVNYIIACMVEPFKKIN